MSQKEIDVPKKAAEPQSPATVEEQLPLFEAKALESVAAQDGRWRSGMHDPIAARKGSWKKDFTTVSNMEVNPLATPSDVVDLDFNRDLGFPGEFPYTRGIHPTGYRGKLWTMRQFAGFGTPKQSNERYKYLLALGQHGLSIAFHLPTLYGDDSDHH